jgi:hypothetical protein
VRPKDEDFRWVTARHACSPFEVHKRLQSGCERDVKERNELQRPVPADSFAAFKIISSEPDRFSVLREGPSGLNASIAFVCYPTGISVRRDDGTTVVEATLTLNDDGDCRLKAGNSELSCWQFRKRALEDLFFGF